MSWRFTLYVRASETRFLSAEVRQNASVTNRTETPSAAMHHAVTRPSLPATTPFAKRDERPK